MSLVRLQLLVALLVLFQALQDLFACFLRPHLTFLFRHLGVICRKLQHCFDRFLFLHEFPISLFLLIPQVSEVLVGARMVVDWASNLTPIGSNLV